MATNRFNYNDKFSLKDQKVGISSNTPEESLEVASGTLKGVDLQNTGITTFSTYEGFLNKKTSYTANVGIETGISGTLSGEIVIGAGLTMSVGTGATTGQGSVASVKVSNTFTPPIGGTNDRPSAPKPGALYYNKDFKTIEYWDGNFWRQVDNTTRSTRAIICGGSEPSNPYLSDIDTVNISTKGNATHFGNMQYAAYAPSACASETRGIIAGGKASPATINVIDYVTIASEGNGQDFGDCTQAMVHGSAASSSTRGVMLGDYNVDNVMNYVEIATEGNALDFGDLTEGRHTHTSASSPIHGFVIGGNTSDGNVGSIERITFSTTGSAIKFGDLSEIRGSTPGGASNSVTAIIYGGRTRDSTLLNTIEKMNMSTQGSSVSFGDIKQAGNQVNGAASSSTRVITMGGLLAPSNAYTNSIYFITISSSGGAEDFGDLTHPKSYHYATSDSHGGLGGF